MSDFHPANRLNMAGYPFAELGRIASWRREEKLPLFDLSIGDPDLPPPGFIVEAAKGSLDDPASHTYPSSRGDKTVRLSIARWFSARFNVELDPDDQICVLIGAKEGLANIARALVNPGDEVGVPDPAYPVYGRAGCQMVEGKLRLLKLYPEENFLPDLKAAQGVKLLYLNYPNNPTGATASDEFLIQLADFAASDPHMTVAYDMAYGEVCFDRPSRSLLEFTPHAIEFHSLSKMANATGYRVGFAVGDANRIRALVRIKEEMDSGAPLPFQRALAALLDKYRGANPPSVMVKAREMYRRRRERLMDGLEQLGFELFRSDATFYVWFRVGVDEMPFIMKAAEQGVLLTPGSGFGSGGRGWARASATTADDTIERAIHILKNLY